MSRKERTKRYEKTLNGFLVRSYRNMKSRIEGIQKGKFHLYEGKEIILKEEFYEFSKADDNFKILWKLWKMSNYDRNRTPSIDRVDSSIGYLPENMEWVTFLENSSRAIWNRTKNPLPLSALIWKAERDASNLTSNIIPDRFKIKDYRVSNRDRPKGVRGKQKS